MDRWSLYDLDLDLQGHENYVIGHNSIIYVIEISDISHTVVVVVITSVKEFEGGYDFGSVFLSVCF